MANEFSTQNRISNEQLARQNWERYEYGRMRGHITYCAAAKRNERFYLGGGAQWEAEDQAVMELSQRLPAEINEIMPAVNTAIGYQIHNRMDISFLPRSGDADQQRAELFSKVLKQISDANRLPWVETQVFSDGMIQQRGYYDLRLDFGDNLMGEVKITELDPLDVIPDPDAKSYDPDDWSDVIVTRYMSLNEIRSMYGEQAAGALENEFSDDDASDFGDDSQTEGRPRFGMVSAGLAGTDSEQRLRRRRIVDRQYFEFALARVAVYPTGDMATLPDDSPPEKLAEVQLSGAQLVKRMVRRVRWTVSTERVVLHDAYSPYDHFTIVPYFPFFRRGQTRGLVDNAISPQQILNKSVSQYLAIINTSANSGWIVEQNSLTNLTPQDLEEQGAANGLVLEHAPGSRVPQKIQPNQVPTGIDRLIDRSTLSVKETTGISDALRGLNGPEVSGVAIQAKQFGGQQALAVPLDNLARTRHMLASRIRDLVQRFYDAERVIRVTGTDAAGKPVSESYTINQFDPITGAYLNDLTVGKYDVVVSEKPTTATWENSQFQQALELTKAGLPIPPDVLVRYSSLSDKPEILKRLREQQAQQQNSQPAPMDAAKISLMQAQAAKMQADTTRAAVGSIADATAAAVQVATSAAIAPVADEILASAGFKDENAQGGAVSIST